MSPSSLRLLAAILACVLTPNSLAQQCDCTTPPSVGCSDCDPVISPCDCDLASVRDASIPAAADPLTFVRVVLVVTRNTDGSNPALEIGELRDLVDELRQDFASYRLGFHADLHHVDDTDFNSSTSSKTVAQLKDLHAQLPGQQCNVFVTPLYPNAIATFPWLAHRLEKQGGIVGNPWFLFPGVHGLTHEMGHTFGLYHCHHNTYPPPWSDCTDPCYAWADGSGGDVTGDLCSDTPPILDDMDLGCADSGLIDPCSGLPWGVTLPANFMAPGNTYGYGCGDHFSRQQAGRMHCWIGSRLASWVVLTGDVTDDGAVNQADLDRVNATLGPCVVGIPEDLDGNGVVDTDDANIVLSHWTG